MYNLNSIENNQCAIKWDTYFDAKRCFYSLHKQIFHIFKIVASLSVVQGNPIVFYVNVGTSASPRLRVRATP